MYLSALTKEQCEKVRQWRNKDIAMYRTPFYLTKEMQEDFFEKVVCDRRSTNRFFAIMDTSWQEVFVGMCGFVNISWENRSAEISLVIDPQLHKQGRGEDSLLLLLHEAFKNMNLENVYGECYWCSPALGFWQHICEKYGAEHVLLPTRKYWNGEYHNSLYFNFNRTAYYDNI